MPMGALGIGLDAVGLGVDIFGGISAMGHAKEAARLEKEMAGVEMQEDDTRQNAMHMTAQRQMLQQVRNNQMARSQALATANSEGAAKGSGLSGAYGSIGGQTGTNLAGISQNLQFGDRMFELNRQLSALKMSKADVEGKLSTDKGIMDIGGGIMGLGKALG